jgi:hypothetical protein
MLTSIPIKLFCFGIGFWMIGCQDDHRADSNKTKAFADLKCFPVYNCENQALMLENQGALK